MKTFVLTAVLLTSCLGFAESMTFSKATSAELQARAGQEAATPGIPKTNASDARMDGVLTLKDPGLDRRESPWRWSTEFRLQSFAPQGRAQMNNGQNFDLGSVGSTPYPIIEFGLDRQFAATPAATWFAGVHAEGGYATQRTQVVFPSGATSPDSHLNTTLLGLVGTVSARPSSLPKWQLDLGVSDGQFGYTNSSPNSSASLSQSVHFIGARTGVHYWPSEAWALGLQNDRLFVTGKSSADLPNDNLSISTRASW